MTFPYNNKVVALSLTLYRSSTLKADILCAGLGIPKSGRDQHRDQTQCLENGRVKPSMQEGIPAKTRRQYFKSWYSACVVLLVRTYLSNNGQPPQSLYFSQQSDATRRCDSYKHASRRLARQQIQCHTQVNHQEFLLSIVSPTQTGRCCHQ